MKILLLGSGGREHALAWKMKQSPLCNELFIAPGNAGTSEVGENVAISSSDFAAIRSFCIDRQIDCVVVGPEEPLVKGIYDYLTQDEESSNQSWKGIVIGPSAAAARLEGSKAFSKHFMQRHNIPTAGYAEFDEYNYAAGKMYIAEHSLPVVLKADGLAAGKGVIICETHEHASAAFEEMIKGKQFGDASSKVVVEEFLQGIELSVFVLTDGADYQVIGHAKDYKRIGEGDLGLNTGGMGCVSPVPFADSAFMKKVEERIIRPTIRGLHTEGMVYKGFIFIGLMNNNGEPYVIEYNCRMGDPETEVVMPRLKNDLLELFLAVDNNTLDHIQISYDDRCVATVVAVSGGYPGEYQKGIAISIQPSAGRETLSEGVMIFHAGTALQNGNLVTNGGRVLAVTSVGETITKAVQQSVAAMQEISFEGMYYRSDIGYEFKD
ncbi:phosphoribosylamine--glycine ligase [Segetibacter sp. 3557_3]|uniref:phosphoribosylamine--glycine ligase n=1 Tax=Segetibacter sp. 3557_3 TaxID=2547429 RepID=UPI0010586ECF|nr:phosphoribosylamine--glycine ligase [Segetibacter sp. 3557_3]TDH23254.1 phosphoribosylamine--glycine ligase [Segetibacter sp. 3557_3]